MREFKGGRGQERDVEEREQLVLRADTGHVGKGSAAAYGAVKRPFSLSLHLSAWTLISVSLRRPRPATQLWPASRTQAFLRSASSLCWNPGAAVSTNSAHTRNVLHPCEMQLHLCVDPSVGHSCLCSAEDRFWFFSSSFICLSVLAMKSKPHPFHINFIRRLKLFSSLWDVYVLRLNEIIDFSYPTYTHAEDVTWWC